MKIIANHQRLYMGGCLVLAMAVLAANLLKLSQLEFQPLGASPGVVNQMRMRLLQFDEIMAVRGMDSDARLNLPIMLTRLSKPNALPAKAHAPNAEESLTSPGMTLLPQLTGILQIIQNTVGPRYLAVLDGKVYVEKDHVSGFRIEEISARGIVLRQRDQQWFIPAPEVYFSIGQRP